MGTVRILNKLIQRVKNDDKFFLDESIPLSYLVRMVISKLFMLVNGLFITHKFKVFIHHSSVIKCKKKIKWTGVATIDKNCHIDALSHEGIAFGSNVSIGKNTTIECSGTLRLLGKGLIVGNNVGMGTHGFYGCAGGVEIGDNTIFGNYVSVHSENHVFSKLDTPIRQQGVTRQGIKIGKDCWIGAKVTILDGAKIGDGCVIAAGAVVRGEIPPYSVIGGIPAKIIKSRIL